LTPPRGAVRRSRCGCPWKPLCMPRTTLLIADDHAVVAQALAQMLARAYDVVAIVNDGVEVVEAARRLRPDVIVSDLSMPGLSGLDALRRLKAEGVRTRVIFLTMYDDPALAAEAMRAGASGYLLKQAAGEELLAAIRDVLAGRVYVSPQLAGDVIASIASPKPASDDKLTLRQREVLRLVAQGKSMKEVAAVLHLSPRTVETHKYEMMHSLGVHTTAELIRFAYQHGMADY
jgi:DNA-binding NarL/FixJ family response regulator